MGQGDAKLWLLPWVKGDPFLGQVPWGKGGGGQGEIGTNRPVWDKVSPEPSSWASGSRVEAAARCLESSEVRPEMTGVPACGRTEALVATEMPGRGPGHGWSRNAAWAELASSTA